MFRLFLVLLFCFTMGLQAANSNDWQVFKHDGVVYRLDLDGIEPTIGQIQFNGIKAGDIIVDTSGEIVYMVESRDSSLMFVQIAQIGDLFADGSVPVTGPLDFQNHIFSSGFYTNIATVHTNFTPSTTSGDFQEITLTNDVTVANITGITGASFISFKFTQDAVGGHAVTWDSFYQADASAGFPVINVTTSATTFVTLHVYATNAVAVAVGPAGLVAP